MRCQGAAGGAAGSRSGIAMIIVMIVIMVLGVLAGGFAYSMRVETKLAKNTSMEVDVEWLGRSGVELAKYVIGQQATLTPQFTALNQKWAGAVGNTNDFLAAITLENNEMGPGTFSVKIVDAERKLNINNIPQEKLQQMFGLLGVDVRDSSSIADAVLDWIDPDDNPRLSGAESDDYYLTLKPPYFAKNGPMGDISELLLVRGITPEMYYGSTGVAAAAPGAHARGLIRPGGGLAGAGGAGMPGVGLVHLFAAVSTPLVNINTASSAVLQFAGGLDEFMASAILRARAGFDGQEGTDDDVPFTNVGEIVRYLNLPPTVVAEMGRYFMVQSFTFEVTVDVQVDRYQRRLKALLRRNNQNDVPVLWMRWD